MPTLGESFRGEGNHSTRNNKPHRLGYETVKALYKSNTAYEILLGSRSVEKGDKAIKQLQSEHSSSKSSLVNVQIDIESDDSIKALYNHVSDTYGRLDILLNNAGAQLDHQIDFDDISSIRAMWNKSWDVNVAGTQVMTYVFVPLLLKSKAPRLLFITSGTSPLKSTEDPNFAVNKPPAAGWPKGEPNRIAAYRATKCGLNMMYREWVKTLSADGVKVIAVSPGMLATGLAGAGKEDVLRKMGALEPEVGGQFVASVVQGERDADAGLVVRQVGKQYPTPIQPW